MNALQFKGSKLNDYAISYMLVYLLFENSIPSFNAKDKIWCLMYILIKLVAWHCKRHI